MIVFCIYCCETYSALSSTKTATGTITIDYPKLVTLTFEYHADGDSLENIGSLPSTTSVYVGSVLNTDSGYFEITYNGETTQLFDMDFEKNDMHFHVDNIWISGNTEGVGNNYIVKEDIVFIVHWLVEPL